MEIAIRTLNHPESRVILNDESLCHAERSGKESEAILPAQSKHPYPTPNPVWGTASENVTTITANQPKTPDDSTMRDPRYYCTYIVASHSGTLYIGVSGNLHRRVFQHKFHHFEGFTDRYDVVRLIYWESYDDVHKALAREKQLKGWTRAKKIALIVRRNPHWLDLASEWYPWMKETVAGRDASTPTEPRVPLRSFCAQHDK